MARPVKAGLQYFPLDVDFFSDDKIELISSEYGIKGEILALRLLCMIYRNGYYYQWGEDESLLLAKRVGNGVTGTLVNEVVTGLVKRSFFDKRVFDSFQILTSRGIQTRYLEAVERRKIVEIVPEIMLIRYNDYINEVNVNINPISGNKSTQSKVKESKEEESKANPPPVITEIIFPFDSEFFKQQWQCWKDYKKKEYRFGFKSHESEQAALSELSKISKGEETSAIEIIHQSMANGWKGFFELKNEKNGTGNSTNGKSNKSVDGKQLNAAHAKYFNQQ